MEGGPVRCGTEELHSPNPCIGRISTQMQDTHDIECTGGEMLVSCIQTNEDTDEWQLKLNLKTTGCIMKCVKSETPIFDHMLMYRLPFYKQRLVDLICWKKMKFIFGHVRSRFMLSLVFQAQPGLQQVQVLRGNHVLGPDHDQKINYIFFQKIKSTTLLVHHVKGQPDTSTYVQKRGSNFLHNLWYTL